jgi:hypothetical protein
MVGFVWTASVQVSGVFVWEGFEIIIFEWTVDFVDNAMNRTLRPCPRSPVGWVKL